MIYSLVAVVAAIIVVVGRYLVSAKIQKLNEERKKYVAEKMKELSTKGENTLDAVMIKSLRKQATEKKFNLK